MKINGVPDSALTLFSPVSQSFLHLVKNPDKKNLRAGLPSTASLQQLLVNKRHKGMLPLF